MTKPAAPHPDVRVIDASALKTSTSFDMEAARASSVPAKVSFRIDPPASKGVGPWKTVVLTGLLENSGSTLAKITVFPVGPLGFHAQPAPRSGQRKPPAPGTPPLPMQAPPPPMIIELPAMTAVRLTTDVPLADYDWTPGAPRQIEWTYQFWNEPKPRGIVSVP
jgi:hypothetical protein